MINLFIPWYARIVIKLVFSRIPFKYSLWSKLGVFRHGAMDDFSYAWEVLIKHSSFLAGKEGWKGLELGPGDSVLSALLAPALGSSDLTLVDVDYFAHKDIGKYREQFSGFLLAHPELDMVDFSVIKDIDELLDVFGSGYYTEGITSLKNLKKSSYDLIYSQAVLEHIRYDEFEEVIAECRRLLKPNGIMSHVVDFKDHLGGGLNNMRIPSSIWEKEWFSSNSGFYTNRIKLTEMLQICEKAGFSVDVVDKKCWKNLPIDRNKLAIEFKHISDEDLLVSGAHLVMRKKQGFSLPPQNFY